MYKKYKDKEKRQEYQKKYALEHYYKNKELYTERKKKRNKEIKTKFFTYIQTLKCENCGETDWRCLEFDHLNVNTKKNNVSYLVNQGTKWEVIIEEISKCRVLCANCHRKHTAEQQNWYKDLRS